MAELEVHLTVPLVVDDDVDVVDMDERSVSHSSLRTETVSWVRRARFEPAFVPFAELPPLLPSNRLTRDRFTSGPGQEKKERQAEVWGGGGGK